MKNAEAVTIPVQKIEKTQNNEKSEKLVNPAKGRMYEVTEIQVE